MTVDLGLIRTGEICQPVLKTYPEKHQLSMQHGDVGLFFLFLNMFEKHTMT